MRYLTISLMCLVVLCGCRIERETFRQPLLVSAIRADENPEVLKTIKKVVLVSSGEDNLASQGSAFPFLCKKFKEDRGKVRVYFLTASHVITDPTKISIAMYRLLDPDKPYRVISNVWVEAQHDSWDATILGALLDEEIPCCRLRGEVPRPRQKLVSAGFAHGEACVVSDGRVTRPVGNVDPTPMWLCSAPVSFGMSGGAMIDAETGEAMGVILQASYITQNFMTFIVPHMNRFVSTHDLLPWIRKVLS